MTSYNNISEILISLKRSWIWIPMMPQLSITGSPKLTVAAIWMTNLVTKLGRKWGRTYFQHIALSFVVLTWAYLKLNRFFFLLIYNSYCVTFWSWCTTEKHSLYHLEIASWNPNDPTAICGQEPKRAKLVMLSKLQHGGRGLSLSHINLRNTSQSSELMRITPPPTLNEQQFEKMRLAGFTCLGGSTCW